MISSNCAVWLYGSHARGDADDWSDLDVFVAGSVTSSVRTKLRQLGEVSVSRYEWPEVEVMASYGSLFLHHLRLEGRPIEGATTGNERLKTLLLSLCAYRHGVRDVRGFKRCLDDVEAAERRGSTAIFEMSVLAGVLRHASVLACYVLGTPKFGRSEAFEHAAMTWELPAAVREEFRTLYKFRLQEEGRCGIPFAPSFEDVDRWRAHARSFVSRLEAAVDDFNTGMHHPH